MAASDETKTNHRFLDEAGDTTFYGKGKVPIIGSKGVSTCFILGMVEFTEPLHKVRDKVAAAKVSILSSDYFKGIQSIMKREREGGFFFHATDDIAEVRKEFFDVLKDIDCRFEAVMGRKIPSLYENKHNGREAEFYADLLSHLLENKLSGDGKLILNIAERGKTTKNSVLASAHEKAENRLNDGGDAANIRCQVVFSVKNQRSEPLLSVADYFCWTIQRIIERGETRFYDHVAERIGSVIDLYHPDGRIIYTKEEAV